MGELGEEVETTRIPEPDFTPAEPKRAPEPAPAREPDPLPAAPAPEKEREKVPA